MNTSKLLFGLLLALSCGIVCAQGNSKVDWEAEYEQLLESDPGVRDKVESGQATKDDIINWLRESRAKSVNKKPAAKAEKKNLSAFRMKLGQLVKSGKLTKEEAAELFATMNPKAAVSIAHKPSKMPTAKAESVGMSTEGLSRIDKLMQEHIEAGNIQGGATIVARRGKVVHFSTHGEMDVEKGRPMEPDAIYIMASSAKPVIGVAAMMLVDEGLMSLSDPVSKYIPEFADVKVAVPLEPVDRDGTSEFDKSKSKGKSTTWDKGKGKGKKWGKGQWKKGKGKGDVPHRLVPVETPLTIHNLLTHTSGLTGQGIQRTKQDTFATYVPKLAKAPLNFQPGTRWAYGNVGIHSVVPRIIEIVSRTPFHQFMRERVFNPLEMNNSYFYVPSEKVSKRVVLKGLDFSMKGGGGLCSTAEDFLHFEQMLLNGGELFGRRLLSPASVKLMSSNQVGDLYSNSGKGPKGMGFGYTVAVTLDPVAAANDRGKGAFGWGGAAGTVSWTDPENELVGVLMLQQPRVGKEFGKAVREAIIE